MNFSKLFLVVCSGLFIISCKREGTVSGKVTNVFDKSPVEGIEVRITQNAELDPSAKALQLATTDASGNFKINATYKTNVTYDYFISLNPNENYTAGDYKAVKDTTSEIAKTYFYYVSHYRTLSQDIKDVEKKKGNQNFEFNVAPCGRLKVVARNTAPALAADKIDVSVVDKNFQNGEYPVFSGKLSDPLVGSYILVPSSGTVSIKWKVNSNGVDKMFYDTIPVPPYKKTIYYIEY